MKRIILSLTLPFLFMTNAHADTPACTWINEYQQMGWQVHSPSEFNQIEQQLNFRLQNGLADGSIINDISGPVLTKNTVNQQEMELAGFMFDDLRTSRDEMFGDIAVIEDPNNNFQRVELRWYENSVRHIVFNSQVLTCFTELPPPVDNSVF